MGNKNAVVHFFFPQFLMKNSWINYSSMGPVHVIFASYKWEVGPSIIGPGVIPPISLATWPWIP